MLRIIDQEILTWTAFVESDTARLQRCTPGEEARMEDLLSRSEKVLAALKEYKRVLDGENNG